MFTRPQEEPFGENPHYVEAAVRMSNPLVMHSDREAEATMSTFVQSYLDTHPGQESPHMFDVLDPLFPELFTREALARGYDGVIMTAGQFGTEVVAIKPDTVRVIVG
jgi:hypothetical protein